MKLEHAGKTLFIILNRIESYCRKFRFQPNQKENDTVYNEKELREIEKLFKKYFGNVKDIEKTFSKGEAKTLWTCLSPLHDTNILISAIRDKKIGEEIIKAIKLLRIRYIAGEYDVHAEMKMINEIYKNEKGGYIGLTKLSCAPCWITTNLINDQSKSLRKDFTICGTHGGTYCNWNVPNIDHNYKLELLQKLKELVIHKVVAYKKSHESTKDKFSNEIYELIYEDSELPKKIHELKWCEKEEEFSKIKLKTRVKKRLKDFKKMERKKIENSLIKKGLKEKEREMIIKKEAKTKQEAQIEFITNSFLRNFSY